MRRSVIAAATLLLASATASCADTSDLDSSEQNLSPFSDIKDLYEDAKNLDLGDLYAVTAGFATDELNDALSITPFADVKLRETQIYGLAEDAQNDLTMGNLDALASGLAQRFGERELTTEVNAVRRDHLRQSSDRVYAESAFKIGVGLDNYSIETWELGDGVARVGLDLNQVAQARVIRAYSSEAQAQIQNPLSAIRATSGFVLPRSSDDLRALKPGEMFALSGQGTVGLNLGAGVPFLVAAQGAVSYNLVFSAAMRTRLRGNVDIQVVRLDGNQLVVDVGVEKASLEWWKVALEDSWGVTGLVEKIVNVGPIKLDLGKMADKALRTKVLDKLDLVSARVESENTASRLSVARFRFDLSYAGPDTYVERALAHTLRGDLRLAQALSNRGEPGVVAEFELSRSGVSATSYAGIDIFGMSFYREIEEAAGDVVIQTPGGASTVHFDSMHREAGWFFSSHGYTRVGLSGLVFDNDADITKSEANLFLQVEEGDEFMERDKLLDNLDGLIMGVAGLQAFESFQATANEVERYVEKACPNSQAFDPCRTSVLDDPNLKGLREAALGKLGASIGHLEGPAQELVMAAGNLRVASQAAYEPKAQLAGPATSIVSDFRLDSASLDSVMLESSGEDLVAALQVYMLYQGIDRMTGTMDDKALSALESKVNKVGGKMRKVFEAQQQAYAVANAAERYTLPFEPQLGELGPAAIEIRYGINDSNVPAYEELTVRSLAQTRAKIVTDLYDQLVKKAGDMHEHPEQPVAYALLMLAPKDHLDLRIDVDVDTGNTWAQSFEQYKKAGYAGFDLYGRASQASPIDGGLFDIDALITVK